MAGQRVSLSPHPITGNGPRPPSRRGSRTRSPRPPHEAAREPQSLFSKIRVPLIKCLLFFTCLTGLVLQILEVTQTYSSYTTVTDVTIRYERNFKPPSLSYCLYMSQLMNITFLRQQAAILGYKNCIPNTQDDQLATDCIENLLRKLTHFNQKGEQRFSMSELLNKYTSDIMGRLNNVTISRNNHTAELFMMPRNGPMHIAKCVRLTSSKPHVHVASIKDTVVIQRNISQLEMVKQDLVMRFYAHEQGTLPRVNYTLCSWVHTTKPLFVNYRKYQSILIRTPNNYCRNYNKTRFDSRDHCLEECDRMTEYRRCLNRGGESCALNAYYQTSLLDANLSKPVKIVDFKSKCRCPEECVINYYKPAIEPVYLNGTVILAHINPTTVVAYSLKLSLLEYIIYVASLSSLWFGFVIFESGKALATNINVYLTKRSKKKQINTSVTFHHYHKNVITFT